jgi:hypothetical protein
MAVPLTFFFARLFSFNFVQRYKDEIIEIHSNARKEKLDEGKRNQAKDHSFSIANIVA